MASAAAAVAATIAATKERIALWADRRAPSTFVEHFRWYPSSYIDWLHAVRAMWKKQPVRYFVWSNWIPVALSRAIHTDKQHSQWGVDITGFFFFFFLMSHDCAEDVIFANGLNFVSLLSPSLCLSVSLSLVLHLAHSMSPSRCRICSVTVLKLVINNSPSLVNEMKGPNSR